LEINLQHLLPETATMSSPDTHVTQFHSTAMALSTSVFVAPQIVPRLKRAEHARVNGTRCDSVSLAVACQICCVLVAGKSEQERL